MNILLENVIPYPLRDIINENSTVWNTSFQFVEFEKYQVSARSGVGKTTLLSVIYGVRHDFTGEVFLDRSPISLLSQNQWVELRRSTLSMVFQGLLLFDSISVIDNLLIKNRLTDFFSEKEITAMLEELEIDKLLNKKAGEISFGQKQRVAIIRALCQPFKILMLDEPFSHLDAQTTQIATNLINNNVDNQKAMLIISSLNNQALSSMFNIINL